MTKINIKHMRLSFLRDDPFQLFCRTCSCQLCLCPSGELRISQLADKACGATVNSVFSLTPGDLFPSKACCFGSRVDSGKLGMYSRSHRANPTFPLLFQRSFSDTTCTVSFKQWPDYVNVLIILLLLTFPASSSAFSGRKQRKQWPRLCWRWETPQGLHSPLHSPQQQRFLELWW